MADREADFDAGADNYDDGVDWLVDGVAPRFRADGESVYFT